VLNRIGANRSVTDKQTDGRMVDGLSCRSMCRTHHTFNISFKTLLFHKSFTP